MKAIVCDRYGSPDVLKLEEVPKPVPRVGEVLVKVHAASVNAADWHTLEGEPFFIRMYEGLLKPKHRVLGADVAGRVEAIGAKVREFKPGDEVFGDVSGSGWGGFAQYVCVPEEMLVPKPSGLTFEEAASVPLAAVTALQGLRDKGKIRAGQKVLIHGASGGVGSFAVQIAKSFGAEVTGVCGTWNVDMVRSIGADHVIDYTREDFTRNGQRYDLILAVSGNRSIFHYRRTLNPGGIHVAAGGTMTQFFQAVLLGPWLSMFGSRKTTFYVAKPNGRDLEFLKELLEDGEVIPVIDRRYPLSETADAIRYLEEGHARGKVVITMYGEGQLKG